MQSIQMKIMTLKIYKWFYYAIGLLVLLLFIIWICNFWVERSTKTQIFDDLDAIPKNDIALVLGTSKYTKNGYRNPYFEYRILAASQLYKKGKVKHFIVSGDNHKRNYNEPKQMKAALVEQGVPATAITTDHAGFRTLDSVIRSKEVFGQYKITIISQKFHNHRAVYIANHHEISAIAYNAKDVNFRLGFKTRMREYLARCKAVIDILMNKEPKFLGEAIKINL